MKIKNPNYVKLLIEKRDGAEHALISKELITTTEKVRINSLVRDLSKMFKRKGASTTFLRTAGLSNVKVKDYFIRDSEDLHFLITNEASTYFKIKFFNPVTNKLEFNKEKVTYQTASFFINQWVCASSKGKERELPKHQFYYENENRGFSVCDNSSNDCFCEDFDTKDEAINYLEGWSLDEIEFGERDRNKNKDLKAYKIRTEDCEDGNRLIFAESANKAKSWCIKYNLLECSYIEMHSIRVPEADKYLNISIKNELNWEIPSHQIILMQKLGWQECC